MAEPSGDYFVNKSKSLAVSEHTNRELLCGAWQKSWSGIVLMTVLDNTSTADETTQTSWRRSECSARMSGICVTLRYHVGTQRVLSQALGCQG